MTAPSLSLPERFFARPLTASDTIIPLVIGAILSVAVTSAMRPYFDFAMAQTMTPEVAARLASVEGALRWFPYVGILVVTLIRPALYAGLALLVVRATNDHARFVPLYVCAAWAQIILVLKTVVQYVIVAASGTQTIHSPADLAPGTGLGFIAGTNESVIYHVLELINGFDIAFIAAFALSMRLATKSSLPLTVGAALTPWLLLSAIEVAVASLAPR